jgi:hypothetical protein
MAKLVILYWRDIPSQIVVKKGQETAKRILSNRFQEAIDIAAMRSQSHNSNDYLAEWHRGQSEECSNDINAEADAKLSRVEFDYNEHRLTSMIKSDGWEN